MLENVREFADWGPLVPKWSCDACDWRGTEGQATLVRTRRRCPRCESKKLRETLELVPDPSRLGLTFKRWVGRLRNLGYKIEWKNLDAADYGAPTHRKRLFVIARCDGQPIVWPEPTHADPKKIMQGGLFPDERKPYRTAAECIDWSITCPSIFDRKKPLADKTLRRIALGIKRYVLENPQPFIVPVTHSGERRAHPVREPLPTITSAQRGEFALVSPTLIQTGYGEREGQEPRVPGLDKPLGTVVSGGKHALVAPTLMQYYGAKSDGDCRSGTPESPINVIPTENRHALVAAMLKHYGGVVGHDMERPIGTVTATDHHSLMTANVVKLRGDSEGHAVDRPLPTITSGAGAARPAGADHALGVSACYLARFNHGDKQWNAVDEPLGTVTSQGNKFGLVYAFLMKFFGSGGQWGSCDKPMATATAKHRFALVTVEAAPGHFEPAVAIDVPGIGPCVIADIGLRMLSPRELARAQGFPDSYLLTGTKSQQVARIGNSVCPAMARAMVKANWCNTISPAGVA